MSLDARQVSEMCDWLEEDYENRVNAFTECAGATMQVNDEYIKENCKTLWNHDYGMRQGLLIGLFRLSPFSWEAWEDLVDLATNKNYLKYGEFGDRLERYLNIWTPEEADKIIAMREAKPSKFGAAVLYDKKAPAPTA